MRTIPLIIFLALVISTAAFAANSQRATFETIEQGAYSDYKEDNRQHMIEIYDDNAWQVFWDKHKAGVMPPSKVPQVDFQNYFVIVALDDPRGKSGYSIEIETIEVDPAVNNKPFSIVVKSVHPGSAAETAQVLTRPYHIVKVNK